MYIPPKLLYGLPPLFSFSLPRCQKTEVWPSSALLFLPPAMPSAPTSSAFLPYEIARPFAIQHFLLFYPNLPYVPVPIFALPCANNLRQSPRVVAFALASSLSPSRKSRRRSRPRAVAVALAPKPSRRRRRAVAGPTQTPCIAVPVAVALAPSPKQTPCIAGVNCPSVPGHQGPSNILQDHGCGRRIQRISCSAKLQSATTISRHSCGPDITSLQLLFKQFGRLEVSIKSVSRSHRRACSLPVTASQSPFLERLNM
ncbi:hypothetical protein Taro_020560 [Colocasia esculenta]|uniref:Uncharacterized protein n=1 Tax=Colocasia esculenta TaxID=4460 RepID=A0A843V2F7_COLES|nr:hypothetical protein [Colocasia esculenta]